MAKTTTRAKATTKANTPSKILGKGKQKTTPASMVKPNIMQPRKGQVAKPMASKTKAANRIVFFGNDSDEVFVFDNNTGALDFMETGWIEETLQRDEQNAVIAATLTQIAPGRVVKMARDEDLGMNLKSTVFSRDKQGKYEQVTSEDMIDKNKSYFIAKQQLGRIDSFFEDPELQSVDKLRRTIQGTGSRPRITME